MYSLNVQLPGELHRLVSELRPRLAGFDRVRERHTLLAKRFPADQLGVAPEDRHAGLSRLRERLPAVLDGAPAFEVRVSRVDAFETPVRGPGPVVYLSVESPGIYRLHRRLVEEFGAVASLEGDEYTPHITLARGGSPEALRAVSSATFDPVEWTVSRVHVWDARFRERVFDLELTD